MDNAPKSSFELIVTIVEKDMSGDVIDAARAGGADGATVINGRGSGIHEKAKFFGITIEPEKEIVLILVDRTIRPAVMNSIGKALDIDKPGRGISFVLDVTHVMGLGSLSNDA